jgi:hypothetical protein
MHVRNRLERLRISIIKTLPTPSHLLPSVFSTLRVAHTPCFNFLSPDFLHSAPSLRSDHSSSTCPSGQQWYRLTSLQLWAAHTDYAFTVAAHRLPSNGALALLLVLLLLLLPQFVLLRRERRLGHEHVGHVLPARWPWTRRQPRHKHGSRQRRRFPAQPAIVRFRAFVAGQQWPLLRVQPDFRIHTRGVSRHGRPDLLPGELEPGLVANLHACRAVDISSRRA